MQFSPKPKIGACAEEPIQVLPSAVGALDEALDQFEIIRDFHSIASSDQWLKAADEWGEAGLSLFLEDDVPYAVNNDGTLSQKVAQLLFAACANVPRGEIHILEVGAGLGLHARYLLDEFAALCRAAGRDDYARLRFTVTDGSAKSVQAWAASRLFADHASQVRLAVCDVNDLTHATTPGGDRVALPRFQAIIFNYILDVLPAGHYRKGPSGWEELRIRTLKGRAGTAPPAAEATFFPASLPEKYLAHALAPEGRAVVVNGGALACLEQALTRLDESGFLIINDYGVIEDPKETPHGGPDRFGPTLSWGLNFPLIERHLGAQGAAVVRPTHEENASVYARLIMVRPDDAITAAFDAAFSEAAPSRAERAQEVARLHMRAGATPLALRAFRDAIDARPRDWRLMGEVAEVLIGIGNFSAALQLGQAALQINPWFSSSLWNLVGDALFHMNRFEEAEAHYLKAIEISPRDPRGHFNLAFIHAEARAFAAALAALAVALAADRRGAMHAQILAKQQQILERQTADWQRQQVEQMHYIHALSSAIG